MPGGTLITFQEGLCGLWKIPRLFWDEAPFSALSQGKGPGDPPFPGDRQGGSGFLASPPLGPGLLSWLGTLQNLGVPTG